VRFHKSAILEKYAGDSAWHDGAALAGELVEVLKMIFAMNGLSRHGFRRTGATAGGGLLLSLRLPLGHHGVKVTGAGDFAPDAFIRVRTDGQIVPTMPCAELGAIARAMLVAAENVMKELLPSKEFRHGHRTKSRDRHRRVARDRRGTRRGLP
jgi:hypothetical protein